MLLAEPERTKYDLRFALGSIPVRVHPAFWIITLLFAISGPSTPETIAVWVAAVFVSIVVHELGHAAVMRRYGLGSHIVLHSMGGLAVPERGPRTQTRRERIFISAAGPGAGFVFAGLLITVVFGAGYRVALFGLELGPGTRVPPALLHLALSDLLYINLGWGLVNLVPVHPLDGAHIAEELLSARDAERGTRRSLWLSVASGVVMALLGLLWLRSSFMTLFFGYLAYASYVTIHRHRGGRPPSLRDLWQRAKTKLRRSRRKLEHRVVETLAKESMKQQVSMEERALARPEIEREAQDALKAAAEEAKRRRKAQSRVGGEDDAP